VKEIEDKEAGAPVLVGLESHSIPTGWGDVGGVHRDDHCVVLSDSDQILSSSVLTGLVRHKSASGVPLIPEPEVVPESGPLKGVIEDVGSESGGSLM